MKSDTSGTSSNRNGADLIRRAQKGDPDAFATLFHTHKIRVYSLVFAHDQQCDGSGRSGAGRIFAGFPKTEHLSGRLSAFNLVVSDRGEHRIDAFPPEIALPGFVGRVL